MIMTLSRYLLRPIGIKMNVKNTKVASPSPNALMEKHYQLSKRLTPEIIHKLSKTSNMSKQSIERWWKRRRAQGQPTKLDKFCESSWKGVYYTSSFLFGLYILKDKPYFSEFKLTTENYPFHVSLTYSIWLNLKISVLSDRWHKCLVLLYDQSLLLYESNCDQLVPRKTKGLLGNAVTSSRYNHIAVGQLDVQSP